MSIIRLVFLLPSFLVALMMLPGCSGPFSISDDAPEPMRLEVTELQNLNHWLAMSEQVQAMTADEAMAMLRKMDSPNMASEQFYFGLLNQQLGRFDGWIQARDAFRKLANDTALDTSTRELARILLAHNQALINWHERHRHLQKELAVSVLDRELMEEKHQELEQKIEALTDLEAVISHRKQKAIDDSTLKVGE